MSMSRQGQQISRRLQSLHPHDAPGVPTWPYIIWSKERSGEFIGHPSASISSKAWLYDRFQGVMKMEMRRLTQSRKEPLRLRIRISSRCEGEASSASRLFPLRFAYLIRFPFMCWICYRSQLLLMFSSNEPDHELHFSPRTINSLGLDQDILWQPGNLYTTSSRLRLAKELRVNLVDGHKVVHVLDEDCHF